MGECEEGGLGRLGGGGVDWGWRGGGGEVGGGGGCWQTGEATIVLHSVNAYLLFAF